MNAESQRFIVIGLGSMGRRHAANLRALRPDAIVETCDPNPEMGADWLHWENVVVSSGWPAVTGVVIASPASKHAAPVNRIAGRWPTLCEKPLAAARAPHHPACAVAFNYRFNRAVVAQRASWVKLGVMNFAAADNLTTRYGRTVAETMASHAFDLALWTLGPALDVALRSDGVVLTGSITHERGISTYAYDMADSAGRRSQVNGADLPHDEDSYRAEMAAWLDVLGGKPRDGRLATFGEGAAVDAIIREVRPM